MPGRGQYIDSYHNVLVHSLVSALAEKMQLLRVWLLVSVLSMGMLQAVAKETEAACTSAGPIVLEASGPEPRLEPILRAPGRGEIVLEWQHQKCFYGYRIYRGTSQGSETLHATVGYSDPTLPFSSYVDSGLGDGLTYYYYVTVDSNYVLFQSNVVVGVSPVLPSEPLGLTVLHDIVSVGEAKTTLTWVSPANDGGTDIVGYNVYRAMISGEETYLTTVDSLLIWGGRPAPPQPMFYVDPGCVPPTKCFYQVSAINAVGEGALSSEATTL